MLFINGSRKEGSIITKGRDERLSGDEIRQILDTAERPDLSADKVLGIIAIKHQTVAEDRLPEMPEFLSLDS